MYERYHLILCQPNVIMLVTLVFVFFFRILVNTSNLLAMNMVLLLAESVAAVGSILSS
jgi:hypothetical protein